LIFNVADQEAALERAASMGNPASFRISVFEVNEAWRDRYQVMDEAPIDGLVHGVRVNIGHFEPC
jgi:hypothetical protein